MRQISGNLALDVIALTVVIAFVGCEATWGPARADEIFSVNARVVALNNPGASAISEVGTFLNVPRRGHHQFSLFGKSQKQHMGIASSQ